MAAIHFILLTKRSSRRFSLGACAWENGFPPPIATQGASDRYIGPVPADDTVTTGFTPKTSAAACCADSKTVGCSINSPGEPLFSLACLNPFWFLIGVGENCRYELG